MHGNTIEGVVKHLLVNLVDTTSNGLYQSTATNDGFELHGNIHAFQFVKYQLLAIFQLVQHIIAKLRQFLVGMGNATKYHRFLVFEDCHLR